MPVMQQRRLERNKARQPRPAPPPPKKLPMPDKSYDIHGHLKDPAKVRARKEAGAIAVTPSAHTPGAARRSPKKSPMKVRSSSVPTFYIKEGSGKPSSSKVKAATPYLAHIKKRKAPRRHPPPPSSPPVTGHLPAIRSAAQINTACKPQRQDTRSSQEESFPEVFNMSPRQHKLNASIHGHSQPHQQRTKGLDATTTYSSGDLRSSVNSVKEKLVRMQAQLEARREDITKNPSAATPQKWEMLEALEEEVRDMKLEVQISEQLQGLSKTMQLQSTHDTPASLNRPLHKSQQLTSSAVASIAEDEDVVKISNGGVEVGEESPGDAYEDEYDEYDDFEEEDDVDNTTEREEETEPIGNNSVPADDMEVALETKGSLSYSRTNTPSSPYRRQGSDETMSSLGNTLDGEMLLKSRVASPDINMINSAPPSARPESNDESEGQENDRHSDEGDEDENYGDDDFYDDDYGDDDFEDTS